MWKAPKVFGISDSGQRARFLVSLAELRTKIGVQKQLLCLDFSCTDKMYAEGTLLFVAELRRLVRHVKGSVPLTFVQPVNNKVCQVLIQVGVFDLIGVKLDVDAVDDDVVNWRYAHGEQVLGEKYEDILQEYDGEITEALQGELYTGITEAMTNVLNHAYTNLSRKDGLNITNREWWMFSQQLNGLLSIVFCDLGAGIPSTLPLKQPTVWQRVKRLGKTEDAFAIKYAVRDSISRTGLDHRGKGLGQIVRVIDGVYGGIMAIYSNRGAYRRQGGKSTLTHYIDNIMGTLIFWQIPLLGEATV